jgi:hypothetical protein
MSSSTTPTPGTPTPAVPPRSALRGSPRHRTSTSRPEVAERDSSLYVLEVGAPLEQTPSLSSASGSGSGSESEVTDIPSRISGNMGRRSTLPVTEKEKDYSVFGKKRIVSDRDPHRIRDGLGAKESPSGVYTRMSLIYS